MHACIHPCMHPCMLAAPWSRAALVTCNPGRLTQSREILMTYLCQPILFVELRSNMLNTLAHSPWNSNGSKLGTPGAATTSDVRHAASIIGVAWWCPQNERAQPFSASCLRFRPKDPLPTMGLQILEYPPAGDQARTTCPAMTAPKPSKRASQLLYSIKGMLKQTQKLARFSRDCCG